MAVLLVTLIVVHLDLTSSVAGLVREPKVQPHQIVDLVEQLAELREDLEDKAEINFLEDRHSEAALLQAEPSLVSLEAACTRAAQVEALDMEAFVTPFPTASVNRALVGIPTALRTAPGRLHRPVPDCRVLLQTHWMVELKDEVATVLGDLVGKAEIHFLVDWDLVADLVQAVATVELLEAVFDRAYHQVGPYTMKAAFPAAPLHRVLHEILMEIYVVLEDALPAQRLGALLQKEDQS